VFVARSQAKACASTHDTKRTGQMDEEDDALTFALPNAYKDETNLLATSKELEFREFLCASGATEELVRLLVGLAEVPSKPADPIAFLRATFDSQDLPEMVSGRKREDIPALLAENDALREREASLSSRLQQAEEKLDAIDAEAASVVIDALVTSGAYASDIHEGGLDIGKLYAALSARFPAPAEDAEQPAWVGAPAPSGSLPADGLHAWAKAAFGHSAAPLPGSIDMAQFGRCADAAEACEIDEPMAAGLHAACVLLTDYAAEAEAGES